MKEDGRNGSGMERRMDGWNGIMDQIWKDKKEGWKEWNGMDGWKEGQ